jgi:hypothetical protein
VLGVLEARESWESWESWERIEDSRQRDLSAVVIMEPRSGGRGISGAKYWIPVGCSSGYYGDRWRRGSGPGGRGGKVT